MPPILEPRKKHLLTPKKFSSFFPNFNFKKICLVYTPIIMTDTTNWLKVLDVDFDYRTLEQFERRLDELERDRENLDIQFRPGIMDSLREVDDWDRFQANHVDTSLNPQKIPRTLRAYQATGYVQEEESSKDHERYSIKTENEELAVEYSKLKEAQTAEKIIKTGRKDTTKGQSIGPGQAAEDLSKLTTTLQEDVETYLQTHEKAPDMSEGARLLTQEDGNFKVQDHQYSMDTLRYLDELGLTTETSPGYQPTGNIKDFQIAYTVAKQLN